RARLAADDAATAASRRGGHVFRRQRQAADVRALHRAPRGQGHAMSARATCVARRERGFTLLELTIALVLLALMSAVMFGSLSFAGRSWDGGEAKAAQVSEMRQTEQFLRAQIGSQYPLRAASVAEIPLYFVGTAE